MDQSRTLKVTLNTVTELKTLLDQGLLKVQKSRFFFLLFWAAKIWKDLKDLFDKFVLNLKRNLFFNFKVHQLGRIYEFLPSLC